MLYCKFCGKQIKDQSKFCSYCGKNVYTGEMATVDIARNSFSGKNLNQKRKLLIIGGAIAVVILLIIIVINIFSGTDIVGRWKTSRGTIAEFTEAGTFEIGSNSEGKYDVSSGKKLNLQYTDMNHVFEGDCYETLEWGSEAKSTHGYWYIEDDVLYLEGTAYNAID